jgi:Skp family chaperone for outer membrane proteins
MNLSSRRWNSLLLGIIALCIIATLTSAHGQQKTGGIKIGVIDINQISSEYKVITDFNAALNVKKQDLKTRLDVWKANPLLSPQDQQSLADLTVAAQSPQGLTAQQKTQMATLTTASQTATQNLQRLQSTASGALTDQDKTQLSTYVQAQSDTDTRIQTEYNQDTEKWKTEIDQMQVQVRQKVNTALSQVAKQQGCSVVFSTDVAPYGEVDLTESVVKALNK